VRGRELVLADTVPKLREDNQRKFFLSILLSFFLSLDLFVRTHSRGYIVAPDDTHTHAHMHTHARARTHARAHTHPVGLLWMGDRLVAETSN
jgi:hypothetical protein